jgi:hypothetical protein
MRVTALLIGEDALEGGVTWLTSLAYKCSCRSVPTCACGNCCSGECRPSAVRLCAGVARSSGEARRDPPRRTTVTLDRPEMARHLTFVREPRKMPAVLSPEEVARLLEAAPGPKYKAALSAAYAAGLRVSEVVALKVSDIDSERLLLRIEQGKGRKDRFAMLSPQRSRCATGIASPGRPAV